MPFTVLSDANVRDVLDTLSKEDVLNMHMALADALHSYSTATDTDNSGCSATNQPNRMSMPLKNGSTTLVMPATSDNALGVKVVTLGEGTNRFTLPLRTSTSSSSSSTQVSTPTSPRSSSPSIYRRPLSPSGSFASSTSGTRPRSSNNSSSTAINSSQPELPSPLTTKATPPSAEPDTTTSPSGSLTLFGDDGSPRAVLSARTLTAFRTALASTFLLRKRKHVHTVTVFGAGRQAYWHILLTLMIRSSEVHHIHLINRSFDRAQKLYVALAQHRSPLVQDIWLKGKLRPTILTPEYGEYTRLLKEVVRSADVIYTCTPSTTPLFPAGHLTNTEGRRKARYICAIGSYKPHMQELPIEVLQQAVRGPERGAHSSKTHIHIHHHAAQEGGAVIVDSIEGAMREAGEVIASGIGGSGVVELGELVMLKRSHWAEKAGREEAERGRWVAQARDETPEPPKGAGYGLGHMFKAGAKKSEPESPTQSRSKSRDSGSHKRSKSASKEVIVDDDGGLQLWLERGNVIYKSVGIGLMDVVVGMAIVEMAEQRGIGTTFDDF